jgi:hypothetical protein
MRALILCLLLAACARPLTEGERALLAPLHGPTLATERVRITQTPVIGAFPITYDPRPPVTCRERIAGPPPPGRIRVPTAGIVLFETLFLDDAIPGADFASGEPLPLGRAMFFVHEMTHVWQWQNRRLTGYHPARALREQVTVDDPYLYAEPDADGRPRRFLDYGYEQQASLVEEYLCCATLAPEGARTERLRRLLAEVMPVQRPAAFARAVRLPDPEAEIGDVCD